MQIDILTQLLAWSSAMKYIDEIGQYFFFLSLYFLCLTQCKKCFLKKKKVLEKSVRPTTTSDQCWLEEYSLKSGVPPSIAFIKARSVYQGHITVQDTSFAKIGLHIPVQESQPVMNISSGHFVINSSYPHCVLVPKTAQKVKKCVHFSVQP